MANPNDTIITSDVHYSDIADKIREKRGISDTWKPNRLIVGLKRVYKKNPTFKIKSLQHFFDGNKNTPLINHPNLDTSNCQLFDSAFMNNTVVTEIHDMDISSGTNFLSMFAGATNCTTIPLDWFENHLIAEKIGSMFMNCGIKETGDIVCPNATNAITIFNKNKAITKVGNIRLDKAPATNNEFYSCSALVEVGDIYVPVSKDVSSFFYGCKKLTTIGTFIIAEATTVDSMFFNCLVLTDPPELDTRKVTNFHNMFNSCSALEETPLYNTDNGTNFGAMFYNCQKLKKINITSTSNGIDFNSAFYNCKLITEIPMLDTSKATIMASTFSGCRALKSIPTMDWSNVTSITQTGATGGTFDACVSLEDLTFVENSVKVTGINISNSAKLSRNSILSILKGLNKTDGISRTITASRVCIDGTVSTADLVNNDPELLAAYTEALAAGWTMLLA